MNRRWLPQNSQDRMNSCEGTLQAQRNPILSSDLCLPNLAFKIQGQAPEKLTRRK